MTQTFSARDGTALTYALHGDKGPWLVLCHALLATSAQWEPQVAALSRHFRVVCPNTRGHGGSAASAPPYDLTLLAGDLADLFDHLGIEKAHLLGASMNGLTVQLFAARYPQKVDRLVLANTTWRYGPETDASWEQRVALVRKGGLADVVAGTLERFLTRPFREQESARVSVLRQAMLAVEPDGFIGCCLALKGADIGDAHKAISAPTLLIAGESDIATTPEIMRELKARLDGAKMITLPGAHLCNFETPDAFTDALVTFLR